MPLAQLVVRVREVELEGLQVGELLPAVRLEALDEPVPGAGRGGGRGDLVPAAAAVLVVVVVLLALLDGVAGVLEGLALVAAGRGRGGGRGGRGGLDGQRANGELGAEVGVVVLLVLVELAVLDGRGAGAAVAAAFALALRNCRSFSAREKIGQKLGTVVVRMMRSVFNLQREGGIISLGLISKAFEECVQKGFLDPLR